MGFILGFIKSIFKLLIILAIVVAVVLLIPNLPPYTIFSSIENEPTQVRSGALAHNEVLNNPEKLFEGKLLGPEMFQVWDGDVYTGLATGEIIKISSHGHVTFVTKIGKPCSDLSQEHTCGRPLGFVIDESGKNMYVADAYYGIWKIDLKSDKKQLLVSPSVPIDGRTPKLFNAVALGTNGDVFWTDSSSEYQLKDGAFIALLDPSGRLFHYNSAKNESKVLLDKVWFANGVVVSLDNQFVLVAETMRYRIIKYFINGPNKGKSEVFVAGLPGTPDTIRVLPDGSGVLVALYTVFDEESPLLTKSMASVPLARKFVARTLHLVENFFDFLNNQFPHYIFEQIVYKIGGFASMSSLLPDKTGIVLIDWSGNIKASYFNTDRKLLHISDAVVVGDKLYTGCPHKQNFVGALPVPPLLKKAFTKPTHTKPEQNKVPRVKKESKKTSQEKPVTKNEEIPKPPKSAPQPSQQTQKPREQAKPDNSKQTNEPTPTKPQEKPKKIPKEDNVKLNAHSDNSKLKQDESQTKEKARDIPKATETKTKETSQSKETPDTKPKMMPKEDKKPKENNVKSTAVPDAKIKPEVKEAQSKNKIQKESETKAKAPASKPKNVENEQGKKTESQEASKPAPVKDSKTTQKVKQASETNAKEKHIPVVEVIPSDTAKPPKENLKVIKKSGPGEIPNPHL